MRNQIVQWSAGWHFGIAGPWTCVLDPEMLDSGPKFRPKNTQNLLLYISLRTRVFRTKINTWMQPIGGFLGRDFQKFRSRVQHFRVQSPGPGSSDSKMPLFIGEMQIASSLTNTVDMYIYIRLKGLFRKFNISTNVEHDIKEEKMQLDVGSEPYLSKQSYHTNLIT